MTAPDSQDESPSKPMNTIVEQATRRLEQLRQAGMVVPWEQDAASGPIAPAPAGAISVPAAAMERIAALAPAASPAGESAAPSPAPAPLRRSSTVTIDLVRLGQEGLLNPEAARLEQVEELRAVKWPLLNQARSRAGQPGARDNLIVVTSALPGEGKTQTALNLALSLAMEVDTKVLLVDADVAMPSVMRRLGLSPSRGLLDVLAHRDLDLADVMLRTNIPKLTLLPAGSTTVTSTELLGSTAMDHLLTELATRYPDRIVIFDAPPLLATSESRVLAHHVGQVVLVVEAHRTPQRAVRQALSAVQDCGVVWTLLNKASAPSAAIGYGRYGAGRADAR